MESLYRYATPKRIIQILVKERAKCCSKNAHKQLVVQDYDIYDPGGEESIRKSLSLLMPHRSDWVHLARRKRFRKADGTTDTRKLNAQSITATINRDRDNPRHHKTRYLARLDEFISRIREEIQSKETISICRPLLRPKFKDEKAGPDDTVTVTYRPLSVYSSLHDKVLLALTCKYLSEKFNWYLNDNILSYRSVRKFNGSRKVTDFNDGIALVNQFRLAHQDQDIYAADCDIKKFYDTISHEVIISSFTEMLDAATLSDTGREQVLKVLRAYLSSYNFYDDVYRRNVEPHFWDKEKKKFGMRRNRNYVFRFGWVEDELSGLYGDSFPTERTKIGVPQGGALSLMIANVVLNHIDSQAGLFTKDPDRQDPDLLFVRFCDDMILLHTSLPAILQLKERYAQSLTDHRLIYHPFEDISLFKSEEKTLPAFWQSKSHEPFLWASSSAEGTEWIGFLGYELNRNGSLRLRRSNFHDKLYSKIANYFSINWRLIQAEQSQKDILGKIEKNHQAVTKSLGFYTAFQSVNPELARNSKHPTDLDRQLIWLNRQFRARTRWLIIRLTSRPTDHQQAKADAIISLLKRIKDMEITL